MSSEADLGEIEVDNMRESGQAIDPVKERPRVYKVAHSGHPRPLCFDLVLIGDEVALR